MLFFSFFGGPATLFFPFLFLSFFSFLFFFSFAEDSREIDDRDYIMSQLRFRVSIRHCTR